MRYFGYDEYGRLTDDDWGSENVIYAYSSTTGLLSSINSGQGSVYAISPEALQGLGTVSTDPHATVTDPCDESTAYYMDIYGHELAQVDALGDTQRWFYDQNYQVSDYIDAMDNPTGYEYDEFGDLTAQFDPDGGYIQYTYDPTYHFVTSETDALGNTTVYSYSSHGDLISETDPLGNVTRFTWSDGLMTSETVAYGTTLAEPTTFAYNSAREVTQ